MLKIIPPRSSVTGSKNSMSVIDTE